MKRLIIILLIAQISMLSVVVSVSVAQPPIMKDARQSISFFEPEEKRTKDLKYAFAMASNIDNLCQVTIWIRGKEKDTRIIWNAEMSDESTLCAVYINRKEFEKYFDYCVLSEIDVKNDANGYHAAFGGGPAGGRDKYWFEWRDSNHVRPGFYCIRK